MRLVKTTGREAAKGEAMVRAMEQRGAEELEAVEPLVRRIVADVRRGGDKALRRHAQQLDGLRSDAPVRVSREEMDAGLRRLPAEMRAALECAATNIRSFADRQLPEDWAVEFTPGVRTGQRVRPLDAVGCYVPGGRYPLPSTLLMTVIPAQVAGVKRIVVVSPRPAAETLAAAALLGVEEFYRVGGAQAVAALAYGTETLARVDKIVGPGNVYVTAAKKLVRSDCAIDMLAGPTEIVVASESGDPTLIASDLVAQAEHDPSTFAALVTPNGALARSVAHETKRQAKTNKIAKLALAKSGYIILTGSNAEMREIANRLAPEHLSVDDSSDVSWVRNAGAVFVGRHSAQSLGDYVSGPNHVLPTGVAARSRGGLSVLDFVKLITVQQYRPGGLEKLGPHAVRLAEAEGLTAHAASVRLRMQQKGIE